MTSDSEHPSPAGQNGPNRRRLKPASAAQRPFRTPGLPAAEGPGRQTTARSTCLIVQQLVSELLQLLGEDRLTGRDLRRTRCHVRQIAMYVSHVTLRMSMVDIGAAFGRDRTTVSYACQVVEDRRDDRHFDRFITGIERMVLSVFSADGGSDHV
jgi:Bacterial dnaA protein helix-turn-helix